MDKRRLRQQIYKHTNYFDNNRSVTCVFANRNSLVRKYGQNEPLAQTPTNKPLVKTYNLFTLFFLFFSLPSIPNGGAFATQ
ncbi:hypothetical protein HMPREF1640_02350 [Prevotella sp. S7-1-8]|nr:hypothetical protein HMPREF1640_02350 [Prevotella sp. S7-1-8]